MERLTPLGRSFAANLDYAHRHLAQAEAQRAQSDKVHIVGAGGTLTAAYEQLRNAAEYAEENVLLQRAIRRFYRRLFLTRDHDQVNRSGEELLIELTLAGYVHNDSVPESVPAIITEHSRRYYEAYSQMLSTGTGRRTAEDRSLDLLAVEVEDILHDKTVERVYVSTVYDHFLPLLPDMRLGGSGELPRGSETALFVAIHRTLLKSDAAVIRLELLRRYGQTTTSEHFTAVNDQIDELFATKTVDAIMRYIDRRGAALRILQRMMKEVDSLETLLSHREYFLTAFENQVAKEYESVNQRVNRGIVKSVVFLIITKFLIGIAIEVPYDYAVHGSIVWLALIINLFFPPLYMLLLRATLSLPSPANTARLRGDIQHIFYASATKQLTRKATRTFGIGYNIAYITVLVGVFGLAGYLLVSYLQFSLLHLGIFFVFLSAASFLGFRLSRMIRELEAVDSQQNGVTMVRDFLYMPFVVVGRWINEKYAKVNVVAMMLDMVIELPLKTVLRLLRQWGAFISTKKDEL